jgi:predicted ATPase
MQIESLEIYNFKCLQNVNLTKLPGMAVFIGQNGSGKSTLFDAFYFLQNALLYDVHWAFQTRGGFKEVISRNQTGNISMGLKFRPDKNDPLITYYLSMGLNDKKIPVVKLEFLQLASINQERPKLVLEFHHGRGYGNPGEFSGQAFQKHKSAKRVEMTLKSPQILGLILSSF